MHTKTYTNLPQEAKEIRIEVFMKEQGFENEFDDIDVQAKFNGDVVEDVRFDGEACAICTASTSIMTELVKGKTKEEAAHIVDNYMHMIYEKEYDPELLEEAIAFKNTHKQANRIKCATLGWTGFLKLLEGSEE